MRKKLHSLLYALYTEIKGGIRIKCPLAKKANQNLKKSKKPQKKGKKTYIAWEDNDLESLYDDEEANIYLM